MCASAEEQNAARDLARERRIKVLGELVWQYGGISPSDPRVDAVWKVAEELDVPMQIHMGPFPPGWSQTVNPSLRSAMGNPLLLEDALARHPKARVYVAHAGWPHVDAMLAVLHQYPELYADLGWIDWSLPRPEFHAFLKRLVDAGLSKRLMFGSDQMQWPDAIGAGIAAIESATFLNQEQKRDIFCRNAARFFRFDPALCR
jgi:predicted TIM-barrel fold metal-dependent hydrolase